MTESPLAVGDRHAESGSVNRARLALLVGCLALWMGMTAWRLYDLQVVRHQDYLERARNQQRTTVELEAPRGTIFDARGRQLAVSVKAESVFADPSQVEDPEGVVAGLAEVLEVDRERLTEVLSSDRQFTWIARKLEPEVAEQVRALSLKGVHLVEESRRYYPLGPLAAHVLGFVGTDHQGLGGLESVYDKEIAGKKAPRSVLLDGERARMIEPAAIDESAEAGADLHLTLDVTLQHLAEGELEKAMKEAGAAAGTVVMLDVRDSAVLAMASYPTFDPNHFSQSPRDHWRNRAVMDAYEPGSTFKMVTASAAIDSLAVHPDDRFDCENGGITLDRTYIHDHRPFGVLSFREIIAKSSNVGVIKAALEIGTDKLYDVTRSFGFGQQTGVDLPGESSGIVRPLEGWRGLATAYAAFGHGLSSTPLQLANAYAALANGGWLHTPYIVKQLGRNGVLEEIARPPARRIDLSAATLQTVMRLLEGVVEGGTGQAAQIDGYRVAGKTGTAEKSDERGYSDTGRIASFVGLVPARRPRLVCLVSIDEPQGVTGGGAIAAPVFSAIVERALLYLGVPPEPEDWQGRDNFVRLAPEPKAFVPATESESVAVTRLAELGSPTPPPPPPRSR